MLTCTCPSDCNCRHPWRLNVCGCQAHLTDDCTHAAEMAGAREDSRGIGTAWPSTPRDAHAAVRSAPNLAAAGDAIERAIAAGITGAELLNEQLNDCPRCGQRTIAYNAICGPCRQLEREPQGEPLALFHAPATPRPPMGGAQGGLF